MPKCQMKFSTPGGRAHTAGMGKDIGQETRVNIIRGMLWPRANCSHLFRTPCLVM